MIIQMWEGMGMQVTEQIVPLFPFCSYADFPDCFCGAGDGLGQALVPDYVYGYTRWLPQPLDISIKLSPACWLHDKDWEFAAPTWGEFHDSNSRLYANTKVIIEKQARSGLIRSHAMRYPELYSQAVDTIGRSIFWRLKQRQGYTIPGSAAWLLR
jgi:hypothetical protein